MEKVFDRTKSWRCVEYWLKKGLTEAEAKIKISQKQQEISAKQKAGRQHSKETKEKITELSKKMQNVDYWIEKFGIAGNQKFKEYKEKQKVNGFQTSQKRKQNGVDFKKHTPRRKEFWLGRGYSDEEAELMVSKTQSTFSLEKCLQKYGEEGLEVWNDRQNKWMKSYNENDIREIRKKQKVNSHVGFYSEKNIGNTNNLLFYLLELDNGVEKVLKYGLTKQKSVQKRWGLRHRNFTYKILFTKRLNSKLAVSLECMLRNNFKNTSLSKTYTLTEIVDLPLYDKVMNIVEEHIRRECE